MSYEQTFPDKENRYVFSELGKLLKQVFPNVEKKRITVECGGMRRREWVYCGIMLKQVSSTVSTFRKNVEMPYCKNVPLASTEDGNRPSIRYDTIWSKIPEYFKVYKGWIMMESPDSDCTTSPEKYEWVYGNDKVKHQNTKVIRELKVTKDLDFSLSVSGKQVPPHAIPLALNGCSGDIEALGRLLSYCASVRLCTGFDVEVKKETFDRKGNVIGENTEWQFLDEQGQWKGKTRHQAKNCDLLLLTNSKHQVLCNKCSSIKHNSFYHRLQPSNSTTTPSNKKFKRESYMSVNEKMAKLSEEKNRRRKAEKRESYLREKIEKGMKEFGEEDNKDFTDMMNLVEENKLDDDMKLFFKIQRENLGKKSSKGYRWHPK